MNSFPESGARQEGPFLRAASIASVLGITDKAVRKRLGDESAQCLPGKLGRASKRWRWIDLPEDWRQIISTISQRKGYRNPEELLSDDTARPWQPPIPFRRVGDRFQHEAGQWRTALLQVLSRQHDLAPGELLDFGLQEARNVFGWPISESVWRRHFEMAIERDNGFCQWARVETYLPTEAFASSQVAEANCGLEPQQLQELTDIFGQVSNVSKLTVEERDAVWAGILSVEAPAKPLLDYAYGALPGLAHSRKSLKKMFRRKLIRPRDNRPGRSGRPGKALCPQCKEALAGAAVQLDGDLAAAWRRMHEEKKLCPSCLGSWHFDVRTGKSYVPLAVRNHVLPVVREALPWRHGTKWARLRAPYVLRLRDIGPGDVFEADDVTWNHIFYWDADRGGQPYVGRGECLLFLDRSAWYPLGYRLIAGEAGPGGEQLAAHYTGVDIRLAVLHVHDRVGLPHKAFLFENSIWRSRMVVGRKAHGWNFNPWRDCESGLNEKGILLKSGENMAVRHAQPGNPRTKIIERVFLAVQERMRHLPGFVGFNHREYKPEVLNDFLRRVKTGKEHPREMFLSKEQFRETLDEALMAYAGEAQNGRWLPGVSPLEVWENGIPPFPGVKAKPLRKLEPAARYLLSTHHRQVDVTEKGIRFEVGGRHLVFWGDALLPWKHKRLPVRWNIEEPELLHCLPPGGSPFTMKVKELPSWTAESSELRETQAERARWVRQGKAMYDNLPHPLRSSIVLDTAHGAEVHAQGEAIAQATDRHRAQREAAARQSRHLDALGGALGMSCASGQKLTQGAIDARKRRLARRQKEASGQLGNGMGGRE